jgi:predicted nucleotidyltransferase component of viral defense system
MLNHEKHQLIMGKILKDIYSDISISSALGFKGGTCAYFFYELPRFSVDLDFDLLTEDASDREEIFKKIVNILEKYGEVKDKRVKRFTIFALLSYGDEEHNIKVEINMRKLAADIRKRYELKEYLGISLLAAKPEHLFAGKLIALTSRSKPAMRDIYDVYHFANNDWSIDEEVVMVMTGKTVKEQLADCLAFVEKVDNNEILQGLGELVKSEKEKDWVRQHLKKEAIFMLKLYLQSLK